MLCQRCDQANLRAVRRAKLGERDERVAVILGVPMEECPACGERWLDWDIASQLEQLLTSLLDVEAEVIARHFDTLAQPVTNPS